ncbi:hypothetical protein ACFWBH_01085 [Streptomyces sp. NPDC059999]|uniref:hypothetical protein n=1 Tax=Streptomyces sp. NPDC059999 TaxID=3347030 RepID=UPI0036813E9D
MPTDRHVRITRALVLLCALLSFMSAGATLSIAVASDAPEHHAEVGPPKEIPKEFQGETIGIDPDGNYCLFLVIDDKKKCRGVEAGDDIPGRVPICENANGTGDESCGPAGVVEAELRRLERWRKEYPDKKSDVYDKLNKSIGNCIKGEKKPFLHCRAQAEKKYVTKPPSGPMDWAAGKISEFASNALKEAARYIGKSVVWLLEEFALVFNDNSSIKLEDTGIQDFTKMMVSLSVVLAVFLMLIQFGKVAISQDGGPAATALIGLAKWGAISSVYLVVAQTALKWSDAVSTWIINKTFDGGGAGQKTAEIAMQQQLGKLFGGLITGGGGGAVIGGALISGEGVLASSVGVIIVMGIVCILAIAALWVEILLRQVGIMILLATMPLTLAGQLSDATGEWWPRSRNAFVALVLMKPAIVGCFSLGVLAMTEGEGVQNMLVGFVMFIGAALCWPVLAKFMVFTTNGEGSAMVSGWLSSIGSSASSSSGGGGYRPDPSGAGAVGGGPGYTKALESENSTPTVSAPDGGSAGGGALKGAARFGGKALGVAAFGLQVVAAGKDSLESGMASTAAHAGLGQGGGGGRHVVIPPRRGGGPAPAPVPVGAPAEAPIDPQPERQPAPTSPSEG